MNPIIIEDDEILFDLNQPPLPTETPLAAKETTKRNKLEGKTPYVGRVVEVWFNKEGRYRRAYINQRLGDNYYKIRWVDEHSDDIIYLNPDHCNEEKANIYRWSILRCLK